MRYRQNLILCAWFLVTTSVFSAPLRYDGIYRHQDPSQDYASYVRFYPDGAALSIASTDTPKKLVRWFHRGPRAPSTGHFTIRGDRLRFTTLGFESRTDCTGKIGDGISPPAVSS